MISPADLQNYQKEASARYEDTQSWIRNLCKEKTPEIKGKVVVFGDAYGERRGLVVRLISDRGKLFVQYHPYYEGKGFKYTYKFKVALGRILKIEDNSL